MKLIRSELAKINRFGFWLTVIIATMSAVAISLVTVGIAQSLLFIEGAEVLIAAASLGSALGLPAIPLWIAALVGVQVWNLEYHGDSLLATLASSPRRWTVAVAKWVVVCTASAITSVGCSGVAIGLAASFEGPPHSDGVGELLDVVRTNAMFAAMLAAVAFGVASALRNATGSVAALYLWAWAIEPFVTLAVGAIRQLRAAVDLLPHLPLSALAGMQQGDPVGSYFISTYRLTHGAAVTQGVILALLALVVSVISLELRDPPS